jgi:peptide/nickel transport system permease protein
MSAVAAPAAEVAEVNPRARRRRILRKRFLRRPVAVGSLFVVFLFLIVALFAPLIAPYSPSATDFSHLLAHPSSQHLLGTDELGRDEFSRLVWGARASIIVGFLATGLALVLALPLGLLAGYYRGPIDAVVARGTDVMLAFPYVVLALGLGIILGPGLETVIIALAVAGMPSLILVVRGQTLALREADYVPAAIATGAGDLRILFRHILPNMFSVLLVQATVLIPRVIVGEAALSFLGLGIRPPGASWGIMLQDGQTYLTQAPRLAVYPGIVLVIAALAFNLLGDGLRDVLDPQTTR